MNASPGAARPGLTVRDDTDASSGAVLQYRLITGRSEAFRAEKLQAIGAARRRILDIGRGARHDESLFAGSEYRVVSIDPGDRPDFLHDLCTMDAIVPAAAFDVVLCIAVLEHVYDPFRAIGQVWRALEPGGLFFGYVPFLYGYHAASTYRDYYRYTEQGLAYLLREFTEIEIATVRGNLSTLANLLPGRLARVQTLLRPFDRFFSFRQVSGYYFFARKPLTIE
ncbi:MAG: class I SAM-dependent methyltransferase [Chloroflexota bacterium]|nr:MAG: class I SAM-dependent methyltransferase [Chloroflexota bacterium]